MNFKVIFIITLGIQSDKFMIYKTIKFTFRLAEKLNLHYTIKHKKGCPKLMDSLIYKIKLY